MEYENMKSAFFTNCVGGLVLAACLLTPPVLSAKSSPFDAIKSALKAATPVEMPARASQLVSQARMDEREAMAEAVIGATHAVRPVAVVAVVSAVSRDNPSVAPAAAAKAAALQPKDAAAIARAAASAAPGQAAKIVCAVCQSVPIKYSVVATAVAQVAPEADKEIIAAVVEAVPGLKPFVERSRAAAPTSSVAAIMGQTETLVRLTAQAANTTPEKVITAPLLASGTPTFALPPPAPPAPPYHTYPGSPTELNVTNTIEIPPGGGRNYSGP
jgi:hypothetical protein